MKNYLSMGAVLLTLTGGSYAQVNNYCVSCSSAGEFADEFTVRPGSISDDGRYVAFAATATNLVPNDSNASRDIFRRDTLTGITELVSVRQGGGGSGNDGSGLVDMSGNGRWLVFVSGADDLVLQDTNGLQDVFCRDMQTGETKLISRRSSGGASQAESHLPRISSDGRYIVFESDDRLLPEDFSLRTDVYLYDRQLDRLELVSGHATGQIPNGDSFSPDVSSDGRFVLFNTTANSLVGGVPAPPSGDRLVRRDRSTGAIEMVDASATGEPSDRGTSYARISGDGQAAVFTSQSTNLLSTPIGGVSPVYLKNMTTGSVEMVSVRLDGSPASVSTFPPPSISHDGTQVTFSSRDRRIVLNDVDFLRDAFVRDMTLGLTQRVSFAAAGTQLDRDCWQIGMSDDGNFVSFVTLSDGVTSSPPPGTVAQAYLTDRGNRLGSFTTYCTAAPNSSGEAGEMHAQGSMQVSENRFVLGASSLPQSAFGFFLTSRTQGFVQNPAGSAGNLCLAGSIGRFVGPGEIRNAGDSGAFSLAVDLASLPQPNGFVAASLGESWNFQGWVRDSVGGVATSNFTNGLEVTWE